MPKIRWKCSILIGPLIRHAPTQAMQDLIERRIDTGKRKRNVRQIPALGNVIYWEKTSDACVKNEPLRNRGTSAYKKCPFQAHRALNLGL